MNILAKISSESLSKKLKEQFSSTNRRFLSYVILTLVLQEDRFEKKLLDADVLPSLVRSARSNSDLFAQGAAACALVNVGFSSEEKEIVELMDKHLPAVLIECLSGKVYFRDYISLREIAYNKLKQLTGKDLGYHIEKWWAWWHTESPRFRAMRLLKGLTQEQIKSMVLEYQQQGSIENQKILFITSSAKNTLSQENDSLVIMSQEQTNDLAELLRKIKFFQLQPEYGNKQPLASQSLELKLQNLHKSVVVYGKESGPLEPAIAFLLQMAKDNSWQAYWDSSKEPDWEKWYESQNQWFQEAKDIKLRSQRMKRLILDSFGWLKPRMRERAAEEAEREVEDIKKAEYMKERIGEEYEGIISNVTSFGMFIELENTVEGLVRISNIDDDYYMYDEKHHSMIGERSKRTFRIGDVLKIRVDKVDIANKTIDFVLI